MAAGRIVRHGKEPLELETERIILRQWKITDLPIFAEINSDNVAMEHFPNLLTREQSDELASRIMQEISSIGWGLWAAELKKSKEFIGFVGLSTPQSIFPFSPCVEIGWRLHPKYWGYGYATEAGKRSLEYAFENINLDEVIAMTAVANLRSVAVMKRLNLKDTGENFMHPKIPVESTVSEHCLFKITKNSWNKSGDQQ